MLKVCGTGNFAFSLSDLFTRLDFFSADSPPSLSSTVCTHVLSWVWYSILLKQPENMLIHVMLQFPVFFVWNGSLSLLFELIHWKLLEGPVDQVDSPIKNSKLLSGEFVELFNFPILSTKWRKLMCERTNDRDSAWSIDKKSNFE